MKILYIHQYFCTREGRSGTRSYEFARHLVRQGHQVTMLTSDSDLSDVRVPEGRRSARLEIEGIQVIAVKVPYSQHLGSWGRIQSFIRFMGLSSWIACRLPRADVVLATSTPLTVGVPGLLASWFRRMPLVFEVRDLWPEAPIQMGIIRHPVLISMLRGFERVVYRRSRSIIALSPGMQDGILATGIPAERVTVIPNCSDLDLFTPGEPNPELATSFRQPRRFVIGYAGSMGEANDVEVLLDAANRLRSEKDVCFLLVGQGKQAAGLQSRVRDLGLENVLFVGSMPRREVADMLRVFDVALILFKNLPILATNSPNKLFDALAAGRPVLVNSNGWTRHLIEQNGVGRYAEPGSGESLADQILWLRDHAEERREMGLRARALAEAQFDRRSLAAQFERVLQVAAGVQSPADMAPHDSAPDSVVGRAEDPSQELDPVELAELTRSIH